MHYYKHQTETLQSPCTSSKLVFCFYFFASMYGDIKPLLSTRNYPFAGNVNQTAFCVLHWHHITRPSLGLRAVPKVRARALKQPDSCVVMRLFSTCRSTPAWAGSQLFGAALRVVHSCPRLSHGADTSLREMLWSCRVGWPLVKWITGQIEQELNQGL